jgi:hypothetical protein
MYNIEHGKTGGVVLKCKACSHSERVNEFDERLGSRRTQAARAMQAHTRDRHNGVPLTRLPKNYGVMAQSQW